MTPCLELEALHDCQFDQPAHELQLEAPAILGIEEGVPAFLVAWAASHCTPDGIRR